MGFSLKKIFKNPVKTLVDVGTFGTTAILRETNLAPKLANNITRVYASTAGGVIAGAVSGGIPGAYLGAAAGFGRGVKAATSGEAINEKLIGQGAIYGGISGGVAGAVQGTGLAGIVRNEVVKGGALVKGSGGLSFKNVITGAGVASLVKNFIAGVPAAAGQATQALVGSGYGEYGVNGPANSPIIYTPPSTTSVIPLAEAPQIIDGESIQNKSWILILIVTVVIIGTMFLKRKVKR